MDSLLNPPLSSSPGDLTDGGDDFRSSEISPLRARRVAYAAPEPGASKLKTYESKLAQGEKLDNHEQEELLSDLKTQADFMNRVWRIVIVAFGAIFGTITLALLVVRLWRGGGVVYLHRNLEPALGAFLLTFLQLAAVLSFALTARAALALPALPSEEQMLASGSAAAVSAALFIFCLALKGLLSLPNAWLPLCVAAQWGSLFYARNAAVGFEGDMRDLAKVRYRHESL